MSLWAREGICVSGVGVDEAIVCDDEPGRGAASGKGATAAYVGIDIGVIVQHACVLCEGVFGVDTWAAGSIWDGGGVDKRRFDGDEHAFIEASFGDI